MRGSSQEDEIILDFSTKGIECRKYAGDGIVEMGQHPRNQEQQELLHP